MFTVDWQGPWGETVSPINKYPDFPTKNRFSRVSDTFDSQTKYKKRTCISRIFFYKREEKKCKAQPEKLYQIIFVSTIYTSLKCSWTNLYHMNHKKSNLIQIHIIVLIFWANVPSLTGANVPFLEKMCQKSRGKCVIFRANVPKLTGANVLRANE